MDGLGFGFHQLGEALTLKELREVLPRETALIGNCGYTAETAEKAIADGHADAIAFGRPYLSNPDLVERFANGWPLNELPAFNYWYYPDASYGTPAGFTEYAKYSPSA